MPEALPAVTLPAFSVRNTDGRWILTPASENAGADELQHYVDQWRQASAATVGPYDSKPPLSDIDIEFTDKTTLKLGLLQREPQLILWRRDVRRFRSDPIEAAVLNRCLDAFSLAPSVGLSQPWRVIKVTSDQARAAAIANFMAANSDALAGYCDEKARLYAGLKLSGMCEAPIHLAVFCDDATTKGTQLGARTMPETRAYSVVGAITHLAMELMVYMAKIDLLSVPYKSTGVAMPEILAGQTQVMVAGMLGAPFWFDLLQKLTNLRGAGPKPVASSAKDAA